ELDSSLGARHASDASSWHRFLTPALCLVIPLFALGLYLRIGQPGLPAAPFVAGATTPVQENTRDAAQVIAAARARLAEAPDDPDALSALGEALTFQADGVVIPAAQDAFRRALKANPDDARAMFYLGLHEAQSGDSKAALERWRALEQRSPPDAPWLPALRAEMQRAARAAGLSAPASPGPSEKGPTQEQVQAMQGLSPEQRQQA